MQNLISPQRITFTKQQTKDIQEFKAALEESNVDVAFEGSLLEVMCFLKGTKNIVESCSH